MIPDKTMATILLSQKLLVTLVLTLSFGLRAYQDGSQVLV